MKINLITHTPNPEVVIAKCASTCYDSVPKELEKARKMISAIIKSGHESCIEHATATFEIDGVSRVLTHELVRHRIGFSYSQRSQRYVDESQPSYVTPEEIAENPKALEIYKDFMALKVEDISAGNVTATQIQAAYEPLNQKTDQFEYQVTEFINGILALAGIDDEPSYTRSQMSNQSETIEMVLQASEYLDDEYVTTKILTLLGDSDKAQEVLKRKDAESADRYKQTEAEPEELRNQQNNEPTEE